LIAKHKIEIQAVEQKTLQKQKQITDLTEIVSEFETQVRMFEDFQVRTQKDINTLSEKCRDYK
jgi:hypothetical protein